MRTGFSLKPRRGPRPCGDRAAVEAREGMPSGYLASRFGLACLRPGVLGAGRGGQAKAGLNRFVVAAARRGRRHEGAGVRPPRRGSPGALRERDDFQGLLAGLVAQARKPRSAPKKERREKGYRRAPRLAQGTETNSMSKTSV